jgi:ABC-2 type transport system permease protein
MIQTLRRTATAYGVFAALIAKQFMAYPLAFWVQFFTQFIAMAVTVYFWRGIYLGQATLGGLNLRQTLNYMMLAQLVFPLLQASLIGQFGSLLRDGQLAIELLRPVDFQFQKFAYFQVGSWILLVQQLPLFGVAWLLLGLELPADPTVWIAFTVSLLLGQAILLFFDWIFSCLAFYTTDAMGFYLARTAVSSFFSGLLVPLAMMPGWLQTVAYSFPFAQAISVPVSLLSGIIPLTDLPRIWLIQVVWLIGLAGISRLVFRIAIRKVTFQGG